MDVLKYFYEEPASLEVLTPENRDYLRRLAQGPRQVDGFQIVHGSVLDEDEYLIDPSALVRMLRRQVDPHWSDLAARGMTTPHDRYRDSSEVDGASPGR